MYFEHYREQQVLMAQLWEFFEAEIIDQTIYGSYSGKQTRDFIYVSDVAEIFEKSAFSDKNQTIC